MNAPIAFGLYVFVSVVTLWLGLLWLWPQRNKLRGHGTAVKTLAGALTIVLLFVPIGSVALWNRVFSFYANPSLPMLCIVCVALLQRLFGLTFLRRSDWTAIWVFGAIAGSALYLHPLIAGSFDLYYWGWEREKSAWALGALAVGFFACGSRFGVLLLAGLLAYAIGALESRNCWDHVIDPFYWLISLCALTARAVTAKARRARETIAYPRQV